MYSLSSDHNCLRLDFGHFRQKGKVISRRKKAKRYLPNRSIESVVDDFEACAEMHEATTYDEYMSPLHRVKIAEYDKRIFQSLREDGKNAALKFWQYVRTPDRRQQSSPQLRDADTNQPVTQVRQHLTRYITGLFGSTGNDGDRDASTAAPLHPALGERQEEKEPRWAVSSVTVNHAIARMSTRAAMGPDEVPARLVKCLRPEAREKLADQLSSILAGSEIPKDLRQGRITLILKQGGEADLLQSYCPITTTLLRLSGECTKEGVVTLGDAEVSSCIEYKYLGVKLSASMDMYSLYEVKTREV
ncbi:hypothetical protein HPB50_028639 [Hyalomma asiaticum]|nr:hypothetical protein HPB50_028639 [Hyalomma asiaticum]